MQKIKIYADEAGRGPLAGPVYMGIVLTYNDLDLPQNIFKDSKKLSPKKRQTLYQKILAFEKEKKLFFASGVADNHEIDKYGIVKALNIAFCRGFWQVLEKYYLNVLKTKFETSNFGDEIIGDIEISSIFETKNITYENIKKLLAILNKFLKISGVIVDGNSDWGLTKDIGLNIKAVIDGDQKIQMISAASIIAKVQRDEFMTQISSTFPQYGFEKHKGYGTKLHKQMIEKYGISPIHRKSFLNLGEKPKELVVVEFQVSQKIKLEKPKLLLHICCAPDLAYPLRFLKEYFKLYLYWYNPNIHPFDEHQKRYNEYIKLLNLEKGDYEILESSYNPKEFFDYLYSHRQQIGMSAQNMKEFMEEIKNYQEKSQKCDLCYRLRLEQPAMIAQKHNIKYFTSTLLISPKKDIERLFKYGKEAGEMFGTRFLFWDFRKGGGYQKSCQITKEYGLRRQNYCGCIWTKRDL